MDKVLLLTILAVVLIYIGAWMYLDYKGHIIYCICIVLAMKCLTTNYDYYTQIIAQKDAEIETLKESKSNYYYLGAEIYKQEAISSEQYKISFVDVENGNIYAWISPYAYDEDAPYLLTMDSKGTEDVTDDEVVVVWKDMY